VVTGCKKPKGMEPEKVILSHVVTPNGELQLQQWMDINGDNRAVYEIIFNLLGGLGVGYTLQALLACEGIQAVDVVEIEDHIIRWAKSYFSKLNGHACFDPRVRLINMNIWDYMLSTGKTYDAIILDVDNGPTWLALERNRRLYEEPGLVKVKALLRNGGVFGVWAAQKCMAFQKRLEEVFGHAESITVKDRDRGGRSTDYFIYRTRSS